MKQINKIEYVSQTSIQKNKQNALQNEYNNSQNLSPAKNIQNTDTYINQININENQCNKINKQNKQKQEIKQKQKVKDQCNQIKGNKVQKEIIQVIKNDKQNQNIDNVSKQQNKEWLLEEINCLKADDIGEIQDDISRKESLDLQDQFDDRLFDQIEKLLHDEQIHQLNQYNSNHLNQQKSYHTQGNQQVLNDEQKLNENQQIDSAVLKNEDINPNIQKDENQQVFDLVDEIENEKINENKQQLNNQRKRKRKIKGFNIISRINDNISNFKLRSRTETPYKSLNIDQIINNQLLENIDIEYQNQIYQQSSILNSQIQTGNNQNSDREQQYIQQDSKQNQNIDISKAYKEDEQQKDENQILFNKQSKNRVHSPSKLLQKHLERQQRAEMLRTQIVQNKKNQLQKIRNRQEDTKYRLNLILEEKRTKLNDKLEHARENRNIEITNIKQKAQQEIQCVEEIKYIKYLTQNNMQLDLINKLSETKERRDQYQQEIKKRFDEQKLKEEEVSKRRKEMYQIRIDELRKVEVKKKEAYQRKINLIQQKLQLQKEKNEQKQALVLQRKNNLGEKVNDVIKFVGNQENIWELIGIEESLYQKGNSKEIDIFKIGVAKKNDLINLEKQQLKQDAIFLDKIITFSKEGKLQVKIESEDLLQYYKLLKGNEFFDNESSESSNYKGDQSGNEEADFKSRQSNISSNKVQYKFFKSHQGEKENTNKSASSNNNIVENNSPQQITVIKNSLEQILKNSRDLQKKIFSEKLAAGSCEDNDESDKINIQNYQLDEINGNFTDQIQIDIQKNQVIDKQDNIQLQNIDSNSNCRLNVQKNNQLDQIIDSKSYEKNEFQNDFQEIQQFQALNKENLQALEKQNNKGQLQINTEVISSSHEKYQNSKNIDVIQNQQINFYQPFITDEEEQMMLIESRIHQSIKRNILRETMSEDLEWALCIKNDDEDLFDKIRQFNAHHFNKQETKSLESLSDNNRKQIAGFHHQRERSCDDRIFGSASSHTKKFKRTSRINSRRSSISSTIKYKVNNLQKSRSKDLIIQVSNCNQLDQKSLKLFNGQTDNHFIQQQNGLNPFNSKIRQKRDNSKDSYESHRILGRSSLGQLIQPKNLFHHHSSMTNVGFQVNENNDLLKFNNEENTPNAQSQQKNNFGFQMNQLITNMKPILSFSQSKILPKLSTNAQKYLFPIREQMILFKRPGIDGQFADARVVIKLEDVQQVIKNNGINQTNDQPQQQSGLKYGTQRTGDNQTIQIQQDEIQGDDKIQVELKQENITPLKKQINENTNQQILTNNQNGRKSLNLQSPVNEIAPLSPIKNLSNNQEIKNDQSNQIQQNQNVIIQSNFLQILQEDLQQLKESAVKFLLNGQCNDLLKNEEVQKSIELSSDDQLEVKQILNFLDRLEKDKLSFRYCRLCESILMQDTQQENLEKNQGFLQSSEQVCNFNNDDQQENNINAQNKICDSNQQNLPYDDQNNLQQNQIPNSIIQHIVQNKQHKKIRDELGIKEIEDQCFSILFFQSVPGDISKELMKEKEKALKRKVKKLKIQLQQMAVSHDNAGCQQAWKDYSSMNKKTLQIRCLDLEKQVNPVIRDYEALELNLKEIIKLLQIKNQGDLMLFRKLKFIPTLVDICKRILICPKQEVKYLGKAIELSIKIISVFCSLRENRNYMIQTNRIMPLVDLLHWCMNRQTQLFYGISFLPQLFQLITMHIKHRCPYECIQSKEYLIEILICSSLQNKIKSKMAIINYPLAIDKGQMQGQVPLFLLKSVTFIEALTSIVSSDSKYRPIYERSNKLGEHYLFVIENTEFFGVIQMIVTLLLTHSEQFKTSHHNILSSQSDQNDKITKVMPQTFLSISIVSIKVLNNIIRMDQIFVQNLLAKNEILMDQLYHLLNYLLVYSNENYDKNEDTRELLHESILFIGYLSMENEKTQQILTRGENTILQKLCNLPFPYFSDKKFKEILYPTLIQASYKSDRCLAIMNQEISFDPIIKFLKDNMKEELPRIMEEEFDHQSMSSLGDIGGRLGAVKVRKNRETRNPSRSSTNSSGCSTQMESISNGNCPYLPLFMRFPKSQWQDAIEFYEKVNE